MEVWDILIRVCRQEWDWLASVGGQPWYRTQLGWHTRSEGNVALTTCVACLVWSVLHTAGGDLLRKHTKLVCCVCLENPIKEHSCEKLADCVNCIPIFVR